MHENPLPRFSSPPLYPPPKPYLTSDHHHSPISSISSISISEKACTGISKQDVGGMISISVEAATARDSLSDDWELIHTYEKLTALDGKRRFALAAAESHKEKTLVRAVRWEML